MKLMCSVKGCEVQLLWNLSERGGSGRTKTDLNTHQFSCHEDVPSRESQKRKRTVSVSTLPSGSSMGPREGVAVFMTVVGFGRVHKHTSVHSCLHRKLCYGTSEPEAFFQFSWETSVYSLAERTA